MMTNRTIAILDTVKILLIIVDFFNPNAKATENKFYKKNQAFPLFTIFYYGNKSGAYLPKAMVFQTQRNQSNPLGSPKSWVLSS